MMTEKEEILLITDLCERLLYGIIIEEDCCCNEEWLSKYPPCKETQTLKTIDLNENLFITNGYSSYRIGDFKPFLRSLSSMTKKEKEELNFLKSEMKLYGSDGTKLHDFYCKNHLDYRGLIKMGLAMEALDGMYDT